jgi:hypothetical protein
MLSDLAEDFDEEIGGTVDDLGMIGKVRGGIHEPGDRNDAGHLVERPQFRFDDRETGEEGETGRLFGAFEVALGGDFPNRLFIPKDGEATRDVEEIAGAAGIEVGSERVGDLGKFEAEGLEFFFGSHWNRKIMISCIRW